MCESIVDELITGADKQILEMIEVIKAFCNCGDDIFDCIRRKSNTEEDVHIIDTISSIMLLLQPLVSNMETH